MSKKVARHLWEYDHPYYCSESNYFNNECAHTFASWASFMEEMGGADMDLNLVFRWDWDADGNQDTLKLFYVGQRKGLFRSCTVQVEKSDEPAIRSWLLKNAAHMRRLWEPLIPTVEESPAPEAPEPYKLEASKEKVGSCDSCGSEDVSVYPYRDGSAHMGTEQNRWLCELCAGTQIGSWTHYDMYRESRWEVGRVLAQATNRVLGKLEERDGPEARAKAVEAFISSIGILWDRVSKEK